MKKISIIIPCYNEALNIEHAYQRVTNTMQELPGYAYEIIFIDNASTDHSEDIFKKLVQQDQWTKVLLMSRNFGSNQPSILAGMHQASGDAIVIIAGDLQDPPELIPNFVQKWEEGFEVVYGITKKRRGSILRRIGYACFYRVFQSLSYIDIPLDAGDFSLMDKKILNVIKQLPEKDLYIRGLRSWAGFKQIGIEYTRDDRNAGKTSNSFLANFWWAKKAIVNFSDKPLEYISRFAIGAVLATGVVACVYLFLYFFRGAPRGFATLLMAIFAFGAIQLTALAIMGEYLIKIFHEVKGRPPYIIREILENQVVRDVQGAQATTMKAPGDSTSLLEKS